MRATTYLLSAFILLAIQANALPYFAPAVLPGYAPVGDGRDSPSSDKVSKTCGNPTMDINQVIGFCTQACNATSDCAGFLVTNEAYPYGCCYLKTWIRSQNDLVPFPNNIVGQTYKKEFSGRGTAPAKIGYEFLNFKDYPNNDVLGKCGSSLDACFDLCNTKTECVGLTFRFDRKIDSGNCCFLKYRLDRDNLLDFLGSDFGVTYSRREVPLPYFAVNNPVAGYSTLGKGLDLPGSDMRKTCGAPATSIAQTMLFCSQACNATSNCVGFVITNQEYPIGCCYLKSWLPPSQVGLVPFRNDIVGQTYKKEFSGRGTAPATNIGYEFLNFKDYPNNDVLRKCGSTLDACFDLCDTKTECVGFTFRFDQKFDSGNCCFLKYRLDRDNLLDFSGSDFGVTYSRREVPLPYFAVNNPVAGYSTLGKGLDFPGSDITKTCGAPATSIAQTMVFCSQACNATSNCLGFVIANQEYPIGCCYLKSWLPPSQVGLVPFRNDIVGQTYKKAFTGLGTHSAKTGYEFLGFKDFPNYDIPGKCGTNLDACFDLCDASATNKDSTIRCVGVVFRYDNGNCCYLKNAMGAVNSLASFLGSDFGVTYSRTRASTKPFPVFNTGSSYPKDVTFSSNGTHKTYTQGQEWSSIGCNKNSAGESTTVLSTWTYDSDYLYLAQAAPNGYGGKTVEGCGLMTMPGFLPSDANPSPWGGPSVPFQITSPPFLSISNQVVLRQIRVYNGGGVLGNKLGCHFSGKNFGDYNSDPSFGVGGFLSGMEFTFSDGTKQSVGTVDGSDGAVWSAYNFEQGETLVNYTIATTVNPNTYWYSASGVDQAIAESTTSADNSAQWAPSNQIACGISISTSNGQTYYFNGELSNKRLIGNQDRSDDGYVKGWPCGCNRVRRANSKLSFGLRDGDVRASPRGANYTFYPGSGLWAGMIGTTNNGYITAFQWLFSQNVSSISVKNASVPSISTFPVEPLSVGLTGETVENVGTTEKISVTKTYTTSSALTYLYSTAKTDSFQKTFGYKVGFELGFSVGVKDVKSANGKVSTEQSGSFQWTNTGVTTNSFTNQTTVTTQRAFTVTVGPNQKAYIYETRGSGQINTDYTGTLQMDFVSCNGWDSKGVCFSSKPLWSRSAYTDQFTAEAKTTSSIRVLYCNINVVNGVTVEVCPQFATTPDTYPLEGIPRNPSRPPVSPSFPRSPSPPPPVATLPSPPPPSPLRKPLGLTISNWNSLLSILKPKYSEVALILGYGTRAQYSDADAVTVTLFKYLDSIQSRVPAGGRWLAVWGGDQPDPSNPDLGTLMQLIRQRYNSVDLAAVLSDSRPNPICDWCFMDPSPQRAADGSVIYGGVSEESGELLGGSRFYLGPEIVGSGFLKTVIAAGGGGIATQELQVANKLNLPWAYVPADSRLPAYATPLGPVDDLVKTFLAQASALSSPDGSAVSVEAFLKGYWNNLSVRRRSA